MSLVVRPQREDFFPSLKRGHGTQHPYKRTDKETGAQIRNGNPCVDPTCAFNQPKSGNTHIDQKANIAAWADEHSLSVRSKERPHGKHADAMGAMYAATGARGW